MDSLFEHTPKVFTVLELNTAACAALKRGFPMPVWVVGEIQRVAERGGNFFFDLVQKGSSGTEVVAQVPSVMFGNIWAKVSARFKEAGIAFELKSDIEVKFLCEVDIWAKGGRYSVKIMDVDPAYTLGKVALARAKIIEELRKAGLLEKNKRREIPLVPLNIGLITSYGSAAYHDFINELQLSGFGFSVRVYDSLMQGENTESSVTAALDYFSRLKDLDVLVVARGGGSKADLGWFDNKKIAEMIADCPLPVITALGHQIDTTIADLVAKLTVKTPTASAQYLIARTKAFVDSMTQAGSRIFELSAETLSRENTGLQNISLRLDSGVGRYFRLHRETLLEARHAIAGRAERVFSRDQQFLATAAASLEGTLNKIFKNQRQHVQYSEDMIQSLDPVNVLKRGYSVTFKDGKAVKTISDVPAGTTITTMLVDGTLVSDVKETLPGG